MSSTPRRILFLDKTCPKPYDAVTLEELPQGGTESTVTRVAEGLAGRGHDVIVAQHCRTEAGQGKAKYLGFDHLDQLSGNPAMIVSLRSPELVPFARERFSDFKSILWAHDFNQQEFVRRYDCLAGTGTKILGVSRMHKSTIIGALLGQVADLTGTTVDFIYNPVADSLLPDSTPVDPFKLMFISSPHKGLDHALYLFQRLRAIDDRFTLHVANPGYLNSYSGELAGVRNCHELRHARVIDEVRSAQAVFHCNRTFPETFGLVYAEANAVGTPCLTAPIGAVTEVLNPWRDQVVDCLNEKAVIETVLSWRDKGRPQVSCKDEFRLSNVLKKWEGLLC